MPENGRFYGVPETVVAILLAYNKHLFEEAGITEPPRDWDAFRADACRLTRASRPGGPVDRWATTIPIGPGCFDLRWTAYFRGFGAEVLTPDNKHSALDSQAARDALAYFVELVNADKVVPPGVTQVDCQGARQLMANEKVAVLLGSIWKTIILDELNPRLDAWNVVRYMPIPTRAGGAGASEIRSTLYQKSLYINPNAANKDAAWRLIKFLTEAKQMERWFRDSQNLSARRSINEASPVISQNADARVMAPEIERAAFVPLIPEWPEISEVLRKAVQEAVARTRTPDAALQDAHRKVEAILARRS